MSKDDPDVTPAVDQDTTPTDSSPEETTPEVEETDSKDESKDDSDAEETTDKDSDEESKDEESKEGSEETDNNNQTDRKPRGADARKEQLNAEIRGLASRKNQLTNEVAQMEAFQAPTVEELVSQGYSESEARLEAIEARENARQMQSDVADLRLNLVVDRTNLLSDYPVFDQTSPDYDERFAQEAVNMYEEAAEIQYGEDGNPVSAKLPLYKFLSRVADLRSSGAKKGEVQGQRNAERQMASAQPPDSRQNKGSGDSLEELEARLANVTF